MITPKDYQDNFFETHLEGALSSAKVIVPLVFELINPLSVIDVGCGVGAWLSIWEKMGVKKIMGIDGKHVDKKQILIADKNFRQSNLEEGYQGNERYELVSCLEVAEHLPSKSAEILINSLCCLGDVVLFSAAIPGQGGTLHVNEQYPSYWAKIFAEHGFIAVDCIRLKIWNNSGVDWWYKQNIFFFVKEDKLSGYPKLFAAAEQTGRDVKALIHPELFENIKGRIKIYRETMDDYERLLDSPSTTMKHAVKTILKKKKK